MIDLSDLTFLFSIRIQSEEQGLNLDTIISLLIRDCNTNIIVLEVGREQRYTPLYNNISYQFIYDVDPVFHKTLYLKRLINQASTPYVAIWNENAIVMVANILNALTMLRNDRVTMVFPFDGRAYLLNYALSNFFRQTLDYGYLTDNTSLMKLTSYYSVDKVYLLNKEKFQMVGGENINFYGTGLENEDRVKRIEISGLGKSCLPLPLYELFSEQKNNSTVDDEVKVKNLTEFLRTCQTTKSFE